MKGLNRKHFGPIVNALAIPIVVAVAFLQYGCSNTDETDTQVASKLAKPSTPNKPIVYTSIMPQKNILQHIVGHKVDVQALIEPGQSPHTFEPTAQQVSRLSKAQAYFYVGVESETAILPYIRNFGIKLFDMRKGLSLLPMQSGMEHHHDDHDDHADHDNHDDHDDHANHEHHHQAQHTPPQHEGTTHAQTVVAGMDPHVWMSIQNAKTMAVQSTIVLQELFPDLAPYFAHNVEMFIDSLNGLHQYLDSLLAPYSGKYLFVFHPAFGYFAHDYGLVQKAVELNGKEPSAKELAKLMELAKQFPPSAIFVQPQFSDKAAQAIAQQVGAVVIPINPLPNDYLLEMRQLGAAIANSFAPKD